MADTTERDALAIGQALHDAGSVLDAAIVGRDATPLERRDALRALRAAMFNWRRFRALQPSPPPITTPEQLVTAMIDAAASEVPRHMLDPEPPDEHFTPIRFYEPDPCEENEQQDG